LSLPQPPFRRHPLLPLAILVASYQPPDNWLQDHAKLSMLMHTGNTSAEVNCQSLSPVEKPLHLLDNTTANPTLSIYLGTEYQFYLQFHFEL